MSLDDVQTDLVAKVQEQLSFKRWLTQEVPWYQSYMKSGLTLYLLYYMLQVRAREPAVPDRRHPPVAAAAAAESAARPSPRRSDG